MCKESLKWLNLASPSVKRAKSKKTRSSLTKSTTLPWREWITKWDNAVLIGGVSLDERNPNGWGPWQGILPWHKRLKENHCSLCLRFQFCSALFSCSTKIVMLLSTRGFLFRSLPLLHCEALEELFFIFLTSRLEAKASISIYCIFLLSRSVGLLCVAVRVHHHPFPELVL